MDTQFDWLASFAPKSASSSSNGAAPPAVSFGSNPDTVSSSNDDGMSHRPHAHVLNTTNASTFRTAFSHSNVSSDHISSPRDQQNVVVPLSLQANELTLEESKTYMRWYSDILARTGSRTISISDIYQFLGNFKIAATVKEYINRIFAKILQSINIGEFFAVLRVVSHALQGVHPERALIKKATNVPVPPSILSKKRQNEEAEEAFQDETAENGNQPDIANTGPLDLDSFTQFMLTGERPGNSSKPAKKSKKLKSVKFSDDVVSDIRFNAPPESPYGESTELDYSLPMDQLLSRINASAHHQNTKLAQNGTSLAIPAYDTRIMSPDPEEKQILRDMEPQMNHFQNLNSVDTISVGGVPSNIHVQHNSDFLSPRHTSPQPPLLKPNMTGPAQMASMGYNSQDLDLESDAVNGWAQSLRPNMTGPQDMARHSKSPENENGSAKVSLQAFTSQMTGTTLNNTEANAKIGSVYENNGYSRPPPVPSTRRARSISQPSPLQHSWSTEISADGNSSISSQHFDTGHVQDIGPPPVPPRTHLGGQQNQFQNTNHTDFQIRDQPHISFYDQSQNQAHNQRLKPPPPPRSRRTNSSSIPAFSSVSASSASPPPPLPAKIPNEQISGNLENSSTANILDDLKALQAEVDRIRDLTGGF